MIKIDIMDSWFLLFFHKSTYFWGRMKQCVHPGSMWFHLSFSLFSICSNFNQSKKSLQLTGSMLGLTASLKIFKVRAYYGMTKCLIMSLRCGTHCEKKSSFYRKKSFPNYGPNLVWSKSLEFFSFSNYQQFFFWKIPHGRTTKLCNLIGSREISVGLQTFCTC